MKHVDARAALDNEFLMKIFNEVIETSEANFMGASNDDVYTPIASRAVIKTIRSIKDQLEEACKVKQ